MAYWFTKKTIRHRIREPRLLPAARVDLNSSCQDLMRRTGTRLDVVEPCFTSRTPVKQEMDVSHDLCVGIRSGLMYFPGDVDMARNFVKFRKESVI